MRNSFITLALAGLAGLLMSMAAPAAQAQTFAVIVNAENNFTGDENTKRTQIKRLYLKEQTAWPGGVESIPFGREAGSPEQVAFEKSVLAMSNSEIESHWLKLKQIRGETPPRGIGSVRILARQVGKKPGAFGVVLASEAATIDGAKVLFEFTAN
ncbi:MAG: hypothetical protein Q9M33_02495 [Robiginitomaculum sp.]|nr:hypothetical protein [Robiginitomaculum sp.]MDQ7077236.1 hypothetical protein [Robiginitomaculum sp.]